MSDVVLPLSNLLGNKWLSGYLAKEIFSCKSNACGKNSFVWNFLGKWKAAFRFGFLQGGIF